MTSVFRKRLPGIVVVMLLLAACAAPGPRGEGPTRADTAAEAAFQAGDYLGATVAFQDLAITDPGRADYWWFRAGESAWLGGDPGVASDALRRVDPGVLDPADQRLAELLMLASAATAATPIETLDRLDYPGEQLPERYQPLFLQLRAQALLDAGQPFASALERLRLEEMLPGDEARAENRREILAALQRLSVAQLESLRQRHAGQPELHGWLSLVAAAKQAVFENRPIRAAVERWRTEHPGHPAGDTAAQALVDRYDQSFERPGRVALLLPLTGALATAGESILDGFMAAHFAAAASGQIQVYDTASNPETALSAYRRAFADGATAIVGPLDKNAVTAVLVEADGSVPLLALNYASGQVPALPGVYQFGLLPEDDARATAERMLADGRVRAIVLKPDSLWGDRMGQAFRERFEALGGVVYESTAYSEAEVDFSPLLEDLVGLDAAQERRRQLQARLGMNLGFVPRMRHDLDGLFMAARPREGRLIMPQLAFHNAGSLPVYATSHVYAATPDPVADQDLDRVRFCDAPWLLGSQHFQLDLGTTREAFASARGSRGRLFATGYDAYRVLPYLGWLAGLGGDGFPGATGQLVVAPGGIIKRRLDCAEFRSGRPRPLDPVVERTGP